VTSYRQSCARSVPRTWGIRNNIPLCRIWSNFSRLLEITSISNGLQAFLKFIHPLRVTTSIFWTFLLFRWRFGRFRIGVVLTFSFLKRRTFSSPLFPFILIRGSVRLRALRALLLVCWQLGFITLRSLIESYWTQSISCCSFCTLACPSNLLATSYGVLTVNSKTSFSI